MTLTEMESLFENIDARLTRIEHFLPSVATKDDLARFATKDDLKGFAVKDDLARFATKDDLKGLATKQDLERFATKDDLRGVRVLVEDTNSKIQWLADGLMSVIERLDRGR